MLPSTIFNFMLNEYGCAAIAEAEPEDSQQEDDELMEISINLGAEDESYFLDDLSSSR